MNPLSPFGMIYRGITGIRNALYDRGWIPSYSLGARTISVGNLTTGGTGKTPVVALVAEILANAGESVCILTRGYGRNEPGRRVLVSDGQNVLADPRTAGDEPVELARQLIGKAVIIADADRVAASRWATETFSPSVFVLDDAFQHRRAKRHLDIVCIDAMQPWGNGIIPVGKLRESRNGLKRADVILLTRSDLINSAESLETEIREFNVSAPILSTRSTIRSVTSLENFFSGHLIDERDGETPFRPSAFCALGNPENFRKLLVKNDFPLAAFRAFRDHHQYSQADIVDLEKNALASGATSLFTTSKDAVKLKGLEITMPAYVVEIEVDISERDRFEQLVRGN